MEKVRDDLYRVGGYRLRRGATGWGAYRRDKFIRRFDTIEEADIWCQRNAVFEPSKVDGNVLVLPVIKIEKYDDL